MTLLVKRALDRAAVWHRNQNRKYPGFEVPYISHPAGVAVCLARHGFDEDVVAAGALHDVIEDCGATYDELAAQFGKRVADLIVSVSETDRSLPWEIRKGQYIERFAHEPWEAQAISLADKIDNFQSILVCAKEFGSEATWSMFRRDREAQVERFDAMARVVARLPPHPLILEFEENLQAVRGV